MINIVSQDSTVLYPLDCSTVLTFLCDQVGFVRDEDHAKLGSHTGPWSEDRPKSEMLEDYKSFNDKTQHLLNAIDNPSIWGIFDLPELPLIHDDRVIIIGDAAHGTTPHQGSGAGQAIEVSVRCGLVARARMADWMDSTGRALHQLDPRAPQRRQLARVRTR